MGEQESGILAQLDAICYSYSPAERPLVVLNRLDLHLAAGSTIAIVGHSGTGKTTLLRILGARLRPQAGRVRLLGQDPALLRDEELAALRRAIGLVDQGSRLIEGMSVLENVLLAGGAGLHDPGLIRRGHELLAQLRLEQQERRRAAGLSGGERQRAAIARALIGRPRLLLADEPTGSQDMAGAAAIADLLIGYAGVPGRAVVIATHDLALAARASRIYLLQDGQLRPAPIAPVAGAGSTGLQTVDLGSDTLSQERERGDVGTEQPERPAVLPGSPDTSRPARARWGWVAALWAASLALLTLSGGAAIYDLISAHQRQQADAAARQALAAELQTDRVDPGWPQFLHDPQHSGASPSVGGPLQGRPAWRRAFSAPVFASPVAADGTVFVGGTDGYLHALDVATGRERWRFTLGGELVDSSPAVHGGLVYTAASGDSFFALDERTGSPRWSAALGAKPAAPPAVAGGLVLVASGGATLQALDAGTGRLRWLAHPLAYSGSTYPTIGAPTVAGDLVYEPFGTAGACLALRLSDGRPVWQFGPLSDRLTGSPAGDGAAVYFVTWGGKVLALDREQPRLRWQIDLPAGRNRGIFSAPVRARDLLLVPGLDGRLYALDSATGRIRWQAATNGELLASPAVGGWTAYQPSADGYLYAIDLHAGAVRWRVAVGESRSTPALASGRLYLGSLAQRAVIAIR